MGISAINCYIKEVREVPPIPEAQQRELAAFIQKNWGNKAMTREVQEARNQLMGAYLNFVIGVARRNSRPGEELDDLIQQGNLGLMRAAEKFDPSRGFKFSTYAVWWVRQAIGRIPGNRVINKSFSARDAIRALHGAGGQLSKELGREATVGELAEAMGVSVQRIQELLEVDTEVSSLDTPLSDQRGAERMIDTIPDGQPGADELFERHEIRLAIGNALACLEPEEKRLLELRHGFDGGEDRSLAEASEALNIGREGARLKLERALAKLANSEALARPGAIIWVNVSKQLEGLFDGASLTDGERELIKRYFGIGTEPVTMKELTCENGNKAYELKLTLKTALGKIFRQEGARMEAILISCEGSSDVKIRHFMKKLESYRPTPSVKQSSSISPVSDLVPA